VSLLPYRLTQFQKRRYAFPMQIPVGIKLWLAKSSARFLLKKCFKLNDGRICRDALKISAKQIASTTKTYLLFSFSWSYTGFADMDVSVQSVNLSFGLVSLAALPGPCEWRATACSSGDCSIALLIPVEHEERLGSKIRIELIANLSAEFFRLERTSLGPLEYLV